MTAAIKTPKKSMKTASAPGKPVKKVVKPKTATKPAPVKSAPVATPEPVQNVEVVPEESTATIEKSMGEVLTGFAESIQTLTIALNKMKTDFKVLEKQVLKEARSMDKVNAKRNKNKGSRAPSGFVKPAGITKELAKFLGLPEETKIARTDVTKLITSYVKEHNLQDSKNGRKILPDANNTTEGSHQKSRAGARHR